MPSDRSGAIAALGAALCVLASPAAFSIAPAHATPPDSCQAAAGADDVCTAKLTSVTADTINGTITGTPVGGSAPITLWGQLEAYLKSAGFADPPPGPVQQWDAAIDNVNNARPSDPSDPGWYGEAKSRAFLPRTLDELASQLPPGTMVVRFVPDDTRPGLFRLVSIQPVAQ
jgi:hypothetical protein